MGIWQWTGFTRALLARYGGADADILGAGLAFPNAETMANGRSHRTSHRHGGV